MAFLFYSNENNEPVHIHVEKAEMDGKFWLREDVLEVKEAYSYNMDLKDIKEVRNIIFAHFDYLVEEWNKFNQNKK